MGGGGGGGGGGGEVQGLPAECAAAVGVDVEPSVSHGRRELLGAVGEVLVGDEPEALGSFGVERLELVALEPCWGDPPVGAV